MSNQESRIKINGKESRSSDLLSPSGAVYGFAAWLTCKDKPVTFSANHNAAIAADLVDEFCRANHFSDPYGDWHKNLVHPAR